MGSRILKVIMFGKSPHTLTLLIEWLKDLGVQLEKEYQDAE